MRTLMTICIMIVFLVIAVAISAQSDAKNADKASMGNTVTIEGPGTVYLYGKLTPGPHVFTNIGGDTLFLNGVPRYPLYKVSHFMRLSREEQIELLAKAEKEHSVNVQLANTLQSMMAAGTAKAEVLEFYVSVIRQSRTDIVDITMCDHSFIIHLPGDQIEEFVLPMYDVQKKTPEERRLFHQHLIDDFAKTVESGGLVAYGVAAGELTYQLHASRSQVILMEERALFARLATGETLTKDDVLNTPFSNEGFRRDMSQTAKSGHTKEGGTQ